MKSSKFNSRIQRIRNIGSGGFGDVHEALLDGYGRVAIKVLRAVTDENIRRFKREVEIQEGLDHPNILPILCSELDDSPPWFAMPLAPLNLGDEIAILPFDESRCQNLFMQILAGMEYAHSRGIIHRDLKPGNILIFEEDVIKINDFGLGKIIDKDELHTTTLTQTGKSGGSVGYASPEQLRDFKSADYRSDIYALGKILYEMLTNDDDPLLTTDLDLVDRRYRYIISKCTHRNPDERYQAVTQLIDDFSRIADDDLFEVSANLHEQLEELLSMAASDKHIDRISEIFLNNPENEDLYLEFFPRVSGEYLDEYLLSRPEAYFRILRHYDGHVSGGLVFNYCDLVANTYREIFDAVEEISIRRLLLNRLLDIGISHNRFYVQDVFGDLIESINDHSTAMAAVEVIKSHRFNMPEYVREKLLERKLARIIINALNA